MATMTSKEFSSTEMESTALLSDVADPDPAIQHEIEEEAKHHLGGKTITLFGSIMLTMNNLSGPGMLAIPIVYQQAGIVVPTLVFIFVCIMSSFSATFLCDTIARIPGNDKFEKRVEFVTAFRHFLGKRWYFVIQVMFVLCLVSQALASIVSVSQVMDGAVVLAFKKSWALEVFPFGLAQWSSSFCNVTNVEQQCVPFQSTETHDYGQVMTLGYLLTLLVIMPMGAMNLDDNIKIQYLSFFTQIIMVLEFCVQFIVHGLHFQDVPWFGEDYSNVVGSVIFNLCFVVTIPSWVNEKKEGVSVNRSIWVAVVLSTMTYIILGLLGAWSYPNAPANILQILVSPKSHLFTRICAIIFCFGIIGLGIPVFCIVIRYTLIVGHVCSPRWASFWGVAFPWLVGWLLYQGNAALALINWTSVIVNGFVNFVAPCILTLKALGVVANSSICSQLFSRMRHAVTIVQPLPKAWDRAERPVLCCLLTGLVPMVLASIIISILQSVDPAAVGGSSSGSGSSSS